MVPGRRDPAMAGPPDRVEALGQGSNGGHGVRLALWRRGAQAPSPQVQSVLSLEGPAVFSRVALSQEHICCAVEDSSPVGHRPPQMKVGVRARHTLGCVLKCAGSELLTTLSHQVC